MTSRVRLGGDVARTCRARRSRPRACFVPAPRPISGVVAGAGEEPRADSDEGVAAAMPSTSRHARESVNGQRAVAVETENADSGASPPNGRLTGGGGWSAPVPSSSPGNSAKRDAAAGPSPRLVIKSDASRADDPAARRKSEKSIRMSKQFDGDFSMSKRPSPNFPCSAATKSATHNCLLQLAYGLDSSYRTSPGEHLILATPLVFPSPTSRSRSLHARSRSRRPKDESHRVFFPVRGDASLPAAITPPPTRATQDGAHYQGTA